jgi:hypothetical protein
MANFYFQSFGEYKTMLEHFNLTAEEVRVMHNGIVYSVLDGKGKKVGNTMKSSSFGKYAGYDALKKHFEDSRLIIEKKKVRETLRPVIAEAMRKAKSLNDFRLLIKKENIGVIFRENDQKRIYGVTFIDYQNRTVLNGSRLGKEFSANVFNDLFNNPNKQIARNILDDSLKQTRQTHLHTNSDSYLGSVFGLLDMPQAGNDYEEENFACKHKRRIKKAKRKKERGI